MSDAIGIRSVAVVGAGCAGLTAAWHLNRSGVDVSVIECDSRLGGHANTVNVDGIDVDTGFMVYNNRNYPYLIELFKELKVEGLETNMGFSVSMDGGAFEWCGDSLKGLFASIRNLVNPDFYKMIFDVMRFNKEALKFLQLPESDSDRNLTVGDFLSKYKYSDAFAKYYLVPMTAAIWSATTNGIMNFPAITLFTFLNNHLLLQVSGHMVWRTPKQRSQEYVDCIEKELRRDHIYKDFIISRYIRDSNGHQLISTSGKTIRADAIIFACHPDQALQILGSQATPEEFKTLSKFVYSANDTYIHSDENLMPKSKNAWASWNYLGESNNFKTSTTKPVFVTYWLNRLQSLNHPRNIFVSLNPATLPDPSKTFKKIKYYHPQYTTESVAAQKQVLKSQGANNTWYAGAWLGYGFHEDGMRTGLDAAVHISKKPLPWNKVISNRMEATAHGILAPVATGSRVSFFRTVLGYITKPVVNFAVSVCKQEVLGFLRRGFRAGQITIVMPSGEAVTYGSPSSRAESVTIRVKNGWFWVRVALEYDLGLGRSYMADEWEVVDDGKNHDGLAKMLMLFVKNMSPVTNTKKSVGLKVSGMCTAWIGGVITHLYYRLTMDNTIANSRSNIHAHYDLSNGLFETFLDKDHMMYSCALFDAQSNGKPQANTMEPAATANTNGHTNGHSHMNGRDDRQVATTEKLSLKSPLVFRDSLESAQRRKIDALLARLGPTTSEHTLLDIGFGWGGISIRAAELFGCKVTGITLSTEQKAMAEQRVRSKGLQHLITFELVDYRLFAARGVKFDRIISCEMIEAVGHNHLGEFFAAIEKMLAPDGVFVMQAITTPESRYSINVKSADFINTVIFPGGCCPSLTALMDAMTAHSSLHLDSLMNVDVHYAQTLREWRYRFNSSLPRIYELGFDDVFVRCWNLYLTYCEAGFEAQIMNLLFLTFSRPGNKNLLQIRFLNTFGGV